MRHGRHLVAAALAGPLALSLVAAAAPSAEPRGTASTTLSAVDLVVTTPVGDGALGLVDADTFASTATDAATNPTTVPFASALLTPLVGPNGPVGRAEARSDGATTVDVAGTSLDGLGGPVADVAGAVAPATLSATATAEEAHAVIGALSARISGLADALGVTVNASGIASRVTATGAEATQGLEVSDVTVTLGDIVPQDVLAKLPLPDLLAFLETLPVELPPDVRRTIEQLRKTVESLVKQLAAVAGAEEEAAAALAELEDAWTALQAVTSLQTQLALLEDVDPTHPDVGATLGPIATVVDGTVDTVKDTIGTVVGGVGSTVGETVDSVGSVVGLSQQSTHTGTCGIASVTTATQLAASIDCLEDVIDATLDAVGASTPAELQTIVTTLVTTVTTLVNKLLEEIEKVAPLLGTILTAAADLDDLLAGLTDLLADAAGLPLVGVSAVDLGVNSRSDGTIAGSSASVLCNAVTLTVLDESLTTPDCAEGLSAVRGTAALADGLLGSLTETLNVLPLTDVVTAGDLKVDLFTDLQESVVEEGGEVVATAGVTVLDLEIPSVTIDPGPVTDLLDQLGLPDVTGTIEGVLADLLAQAQALALPALGTVTTTLSTATTELGAPGGVADLVAQLEALLAGLDLAELGTLDSVSTPGLTLVIDPVSRASFSTSGAAVPGGPAGPSGDPAPVPAGGTPGAPGDLPATGGGLAVLGLATLAGAVSLRRRG